jgi:Zn-dependent protease
MDPASLFIIGALVISIVMHEVAHGFAANWLGDPTARLAGRLTLNPIKHIDPIGSLLIPAILFFTHSGLLFGWAKPVPYNPYNLSNQKWGEAIVAIAGPATNLIIAIVFSLLIRNEAIFGFTPAMLDISLYIVYINILLALFNMIPIPPLDGSKVLSSILPYRLERKYRELTGLIEQHGFVATFGFIFVFIYILSAPFTAVVMSVFELMTGQRGL